MKTKKFFSIVLSLMMLFTSNISVFAQSYHSTERTLSKNNSLYKEINEMDKMLKDLSEEINRIEEKPYSGLGRKVSKMEHKKLQNQIHQIRDKYLDLIRQMEIQSDNFTETMRAVLSADDNIIRQISHNYYNFSESMDSWWKRIDSSLDLAVDYINSGLARPHNAIIDFSMEMEFMKNHITTDLKSRYALFSEKKTSLFKALEEVMEDMPKEDIYKMTEAEFDVYLNKVRKRAEINANIVYDAMNAGNRELLIFKAGEEAPSARQLAKQIQFHLKNIGKAKPGFINRLKLIRGLNRFANDVDGRIKYVSKVTKLDPLEVKIGNKVIKTEHGLISALRSAGPLVVIGAVLTAATIVDVNAQNIFPNGANSARRMANIKNAIENDLDISASDALDFYVGHFNENESVIEKSKAHYMNMVRLLALTQQADNDKNEIFNIMESVDPKVSDVNFSATADIINAFNTYMENNPMEQVLSQKELI